MSLVLTETAELLGCPGEPVTVSIETVNGVITRETKLFCVELMSNSGDRVVIKAFGVENISEVRSVMNLSAIKNRYENNKSDIFAEEGFQQIMAYQDAIPYCREYASYDHLTANCPKTMVEGSAM